MVARPESFRDTYLAPKARSLMLVRHRTDSPWRTWGSAPGIRLSPDNQALKARLNPAWLLNPKRTAHRNQRRAREATRGILPETSACDGALVAPDRKSVV